MITSHHSFSTRIFLDQPPAAYAGPATAVTPNGGQPENLREFWWFLRSGRGQVQRMEGPQGWRRDDPSRDASAAKLSSRGTSGPASS